VELAYSYQKRATTRVNDFIQLVRTQRVADPSTADVRVMTLHQAKGLEFDIVVLPDLDTKLIGQPPPFVTRRDTPTGPVQRVCRYAGASIQALLSDDIQKMFRDATDRAVSESLCVLYVALTRAIHALHMIIAPSSKSERKLPVTAAGLLRAALSDGSPLPGNTLVYETGQPDWYVESVTAAARATAKQVVATEPVLLGGVRLADSHSVARRDLTASSPSRLEGGRRVKLADRLGVGAKDGMQYGTLIHAWMEQVGWLDEGLPEIERLRQAASQLDTTGLDVDAQIAQFLSTLQQPNVSRLLSRASYAPPITLPFPPRLSAELAATPLQLKLHHERRIALLEGDSILTGNIDRLVLMMRGDKIVAADVIDFKTDRIVAKQETEVEKKVGFYRPQLVAYRRAVSKMLRLEESRISARLLFVGPDLVRSVD
jgi:ATP-dependent exoDNAse (exonuclease V) beta subunit